MSKIYFALVALLRTILVEFLNSGAIALLVVTMRETFPQAIGFMGHNEMALRYQSIIITLDGAITWSLPKILTYSNVNVLIVKYRDPLLLDVDRCKLIFSIINNFYHKFSLQWATDLAEKLLKIHEEEINRRQEFNVIFEGHFLKSLFPGMTELPPPFATQAPPVFDARLPKLTYADVDYISNAFAHLSKDIPVYDMTSTLQFFQQRYCCYDCLLVL